MDHVSLNDVVGVFLGIIFLLVRNASTKDAGKAVETVVTNKSNETQIKVGTAQECIEDRVSRLAFKIDESYRETQGERAIHQATLEEIRASNHLLAFNLKRVVARVGLEWKDDVTVVPEPLNKE